MKRIFTIILMVQSLLLAPVAHAQTYWNGTVDKSWTGSGTADDPILISTAEQLAGFADSVNRGDDFSGRYIELAADIYLSDSTLGDSLKYEWTHPIGQFQSGGSGWEYTLDTAWFRGNFDGKNHTICMYSMGNFLSNQRADNIALETGHSEDGLMFSFTLVKYSNGEVHVEFVNLMPTWVLVRGGENNKSFQILPLDVEVDDWSEVYSMDGDQASNANID